MKILIYADMAIWPYRLNEFKLNNVRNMLVYFTSSVDMQNISNIIFEVGSQKCTLKDIHENKFGYFGFLEDTPENAETVSVYSYNLNGETITRNEKSLVEDLNATTSRQILKKLGIYKIFPAIKDDYYICQCGAVNRISSNVCFSCGQTKNQTEEFINEGFTSFLLKEYIQRNPAVYIVENSIDENIKKYTLPVIEACRDFDEFDERTFTDQIEKLYKRSIPEIPKKKKSIFNKSEESIRFYIK